MYVLHNWNDTGNEELLWHHKLGCESMTLHESGNCYWKCQKHFRILFIKGAIHSYNECTDISKKLE